MHKPCSDVTYLFELTYGCFVQLPTRVLQGGLTAYPGLKPKVPELMRYARSPECKVVVPAQTLQLLAEQGP